MSVGIIGLPAFKLALCVALFMPIRLYDIVTADAPPVTSDARWPVRTTSPKILRRWGGVVSSGLHKPDAADTGVKRGVTEHSKWTSQTLRGAGSGLPLMLADLASGTERKCCRTRREYRRSRLWSACQPADCGRKRESEGRQKSVPQESDF
ncbi:unnamed protein product [Tetraodon nigroviridis]|uniref:(spotted green pufferfish) hypothetical protein n=1 Tax=Tetraodon nigroviridis TaxID=99883 RepID=Q4RJ51_TETNG|nr:unnamed protein product [Tetraodon nigroviridis]